MLSNKKANEIIVDTITTITTRPPHPSFHLILSATDELDSPRVKVERDIDVKVFSAMEIPCRFWQNISAGVLRAVITFELVNYFLDETSVMENAMREEIASAQKQYANQPSTLTKQINLIRFRYEVELHIVDIQVSRKLIGDESVYNWFVKANYDPKWLIEFLQLLIDEAPKRIQPDTRVQPRIDGLLKRIRHFQLLIQEKTDVAKKLRDEQSAHSAEILATFTPSTV